MPIEDTNVPHEQGVADAVDAELRRTSNQGAITNAVNAAANPPTQAEYNALVGKFNAVLQVLRDAELIPSS